jgi:signal transduction histidine kinase
VNALRGAGLLLVASAAGGLAVGLAYGGHEGLLTMVFLLGSGAPAIAAVHLLARRRRAAGSLSRQFAMGIGVAVGLVTVGMIVVDLLMFISAHDAFLMILLLVFAGILTSYATWVVARGAKDDVNSIREGLRAVGDGRRDVRIRTGANDELADLAASANRMTAQLAEREADRDAAEDARRSLVAAVSHDLRTPLTSLRLLAGAVEDDLVDPDTRHRYLEQISVQIGSLSTLIEDLFELSRLEAGKIQWSMHRVRLDELVEETLDAMSPQAAAKHVAVHASLPEDLSPARANPEKVQRVLFNLVQNAIRHTPPDGAVTVAAESNGRNVEIEVADTGGGIPPEERERAFEPFYRGGAGEARSGEGTGLGLTICRAIVEAHGGRIWFAESGNGTRVRFTLPRAA